MGGGDARLLADFQSLLRGGEWGVILQEASVDLLLLRGFGQRVDDHHGRNLEQEGGQNRGLSDDAHELRNFGVENHVVGFQVDESLLNLLLLGTELGDDSLELVHAILLPLPRQLGRLPIPQQPHKLLELLLLCRSDRTLLGHHVCVSLQLVATHPQQLITGKIEDGCSFDERKESWWCLNVGEASVPVRTRSSVLS